MPNAQALPQKIFCSDPVSPLFLPLTGTGSIAFPSVIVIGLLMQLILPFDVLLQEISFLLNTNHKVGVEDKWLESMRQLGIFIIICEKFVTQSVWEEIFRKHIYEPMEISAGLMESV